MSVNSVLSVSPSSYKFFSLQLYSGAYFQALTAALPHTLNTWSGVFG